VLKTFYRWLLAEGDIEANPMLRLKAPRVPEQALDPVPPDTVRAMLDTCDKGLLGLRDRALLLALCDTGARANELLSVNLADVDLASGAILLRVTKAKRPRVVFLGKRARKAALAYLRASPRKGQSGAASPLWLTDEGSRLTYWGLRQVLRRRALKAGVKAPSAHAFRRLFCLQSLRDGMNVLAVQALAGHADLSTTRRYVKWALSDLAEQHAAHSPGDKLLG
jgi:integrase/recombinase XerD